MEAMEAMETGANYPPTSNHSIDDIISVIHSNAPEELDTDRPAQGLESQYRTLYNLLSVCLVEKTNPVAFLIGPRGYGKHHVLESCLQSLQKRSYCDKEEAEKKFFRIVRLSGLLLRGDDAAAGREIVRQLSFFTASVPAASAGQTSTEVGKKRFRDGSVSVMTSFHSYVTLLDEILQRSRIDGIPILIVISDVEAFASGVRVDKQAMATAAVSGRLKQILLYHLLDMASSEKTYMGIVATTTRLNFFDMLEKRIRSRAFGAQAVIQFTKQRANTTSESGLSSAYQILTTILVEHLQRNYSLQKSIVESFKSILLNPKDPICMLFQRQWSLGKSVRWFLRVVTVSYSIMMGAYNCQQGKTTNDPEYDDTNDPTPCFTQQHLLDGLVSMGCDVTEAYMQGLTSTLLNDVNFRHRNDDSNKDTRSTAGLPSAMILGASNNPRLQPLYDLSASQLVLLFSARRLLVKDSLSSSSSFAGDRASIDILSASQVEVDYTRPVTFQRMYQEYQDKFVKNYSSSTSIANRASTSGGGSRGIATAFSSLVFRDVCYFNRFYSYWNVMSSIRLRIILEAV